MRFRKKYSLAVALFIGGTTLAFHAGSTLAEYTAFAALLLAVFGASDVGDKHVTRNGNQRQGDS